MSRLRDNLTEIMWTQTVDLAKIRKILRGIYPMIRQTDNLSEDMRIKLDLIAEIRNILRVLHLMTR